MDQLLSEDIPVEIKELAEVIASMPSTHEELREPLARAIVCLKRKRNILGLVQHALVQIRLDLKYLLFDLEATRRERDEYKRQLET